MQAADADDDMDDEEGATDPKPKGKAAWFLNASLFPWAVWPCSQSQVHGEGEPSKRIARALGGAPYLFCYAYETLTGLRKSV